MSITDFFLIFLGAGILTVGYLLVKKIREFEAPPPEEEDEISDRVRRLIAESGEKSEDLENFDEEKPPENGS